MAGSVSLHFLQPAFLSNHTQLSLEEMTPGFPFSHPETLEHAAFLRPTSWFWSSQSERRLRRPGITLNTSLPVPPPACKGRVTSPLPKVPGSTPDISGQRQGNHSAETLDSHGCQSELGVERSGRPKRKATSLPPPNLMLGMMRRGWQGNAKSSAMACRFHSGLLRTGRFSCEISRGEYKPLRADLGGSQIRWHLAVCTSLTESVQGFSLG